MKGAEATASCIFLARNGASKEAIKKYVEDEFGYDLDRTLDSIRPTYHHVESCQETVPEAIIAFLEAEDFEDAIRNAISIGGDSDTIAAITGGMAASYYGIPNDIYTTGLLYLDDYLKKIYNEYLKKTGLKLEKI